MLTDVLHKLFADQLRPGLQPWSLLAPHIQTLGGLVSKTRRTKKLLEPGDVEAPACKSRHSSETKAIRKLIPAARTPEFFLGTIVDIERQEPAGQLRVSDAVEVS